MIETFDDLYHGLRALAQRLRLAGHGGDANALDDAAITIDALGDRFGRRTLLSATLTRERRGEVTPWLV